MARMGVFRFVLGAALGAFPVLFGAAGCGDVEIVDNGIAPTITKVEPAKGPSEGGTPVVITGTRFEQGATVRFGGALATKVQWVDDKTISAVTPAGLGAVAVSVENPSHLVATLDEGFTFEGAGTGCGVVSTIPDIGAAEVPIVGELRLVFSAPLDVASLEGSVTLKLLGGGDVPADVTLGAETDTDVIVRPKQSLRFWGSYAVVVGDGVKTTGGVACAPAALAFATVKPVAAPRALRPALAAGLARAGGFVIAAAEGYKGLQTYDVADPKNASLKSDFLAKFSPHGLVVKGSRLYAASGPAGVQIFDVTDPTKPALLGHAGTPGRASDVAVVEKNNKTFVIVADGPEGVHLADVTDPQNVVDLGTIALGGSAKPSVGALDYQGDKLVVTDGARFVIVALADPGSPASAAVLGEMNVGTGLGDVILDNGRVFVSKPAEGVASYDVTNPAAPVLISTATDPDGPCPSGCLDIAGALVLDGGDLFGVFGRGGVQRFTVDGAGALTPSTHYVGASNARSVLADASSVFVGADEGLYIYDRNGDGSAPIWFDPSGHGIARTAAVSGELAYVADWLRGVQTFSLKDPEAPVLVDRDDTPAVLDSDVGGYGSSVGNGVLAIGDGRDGIAFFDLKDPANPVYGASVDSTDALSTVLTVGPITYGCQTNQGVIAVDGTNPKAPKLLGGAKLDDVAVSDSASDLAPLGDVLYVARRTGIGILDVKDPTALAWKGLFTFASNDGATNLRVVGTHLVATTSIFDYEGTNNQSTHLVVLDVADPLDPKLVWTSDELGGAAGLSVIGDIAFVSPGGTSVKVFDLADIEHPVLEGAIETPANVAFSVPGANVLYVVQGAGGLQAIHTGPLPQTK